MEDLVTHLRRLAPAADRLPLPVQRQLLRLLTPLNPFTSASDEWRAIHIHIPKCAGTSVREALMGISKRAHVPLSRYAAFDPDRFEQYFKFAFVRNPWDRLLSAYTYLSPGSKGETSWSRKHLPQFAGFEEFVLALDRPRFRRNALRFLHLRPQLNWITLPGRETPALDFIGRFERLQEDVQLLAQRLGLTASLPHLNASTCLNYRDAYSSRMRAIVAEVYHCDVDSFGYSF